MNGPDKKPIELENNFEMPRFKVVYDPEYLPHTTISSVWITDKSGNKVNNDDSGIPELIVNEDYSFHYLLETTAKEIAPRTFDVELEIEDRGVSSGSEGVIHRVIV